MTKFCLPPPGDADQVRGLGSEAAALALLATQHLGAAAFLARRLEADAFTACQQVVDREVMADPRIATGEVISSTLAAFLYVMHQARDLREELDESLGGVLPWCASVQVRNALHDRVAFNGALQ